MENTTTISRVVKVGDIVMWAGCFGMNEPARAVVIEIEATGSQRIKYGQKVNKVDLSQELAIFTIKAIDQPVRGLNWCYADQIVEILG